MAKVFMSYSHKDESMRDELGTHLSLLQREGMISTWHDRQILPGDEFGKVIDDNLETSDIILLLISPYFIDSDYCFDIEMERAMQRHKDGEARVIPIILEHCDWHSAPFGSLNALPEDGRPVTDFANEHKAFTEIARGIRKTIESSQDGNATTGIPQRNIKKGDISSVERKDPQRSSNLHVKKQFSDKEKDDFLKDSFEYIYKFFKNSLEELKARNLFVDYRLDKIDSQTFTVKLYSEEELANQCKIWYGSGFGSAAAIWYSNSVNSSGSFNGMFTVDDDGYRQFLVSSGMMNFQFDQSPDGHLSAKGVAELLWDRLIEPLQR